MIRRVDGTGTPDGALAHSAYHFQDRIVVSGEHLGRADALLRSESGAELALTPVDGGTDTRRAYLLPTDLAAGRYVLRAVNAAGDDEASLFILQGEPGELSSLSGAQVITLINDTIDADPTLSLPGMLHGEVATLGLVADVETGARAIVIDGQPVVMPTSNVGAAVALYDLATHAIVLDPAPRIFGANATADLAAMLAAATAGQVVLLASAGSVLLQKPAIVASLEQLGASDRIAALTSAQPYAFIGQPGLGVGAGLEAFGDASGAASLTTAVLDRSVLGLRAQATQAAPIGALVEGKWCSVDQGKISCTADAPQPAQGSSLTKDDVLSIVSEAGYSTTSNVLTSADVLTIVSDAGYGKPSDSLTKDDVLAIVSNAGYLSSDSLSTLKLSEAQVEAYVTNGAINLAAGSKIAGNSILTKEADPSVNALGKAVLACTAGQVAKWAGAAWACADDMDTDTTVSPAEIQDLVVSGFGQGIIATDAAINAKGSVWSDSYLSVGQNAEGAAKASMRGSDGRIATEGDVNAAGSMWANQFVSAGTNAQGKAKAFMSGGDGLIQTDGDVRAFGNVWSGGFLSVGANAEGSAAAYLRGNDGLIHTDGDVNALGNIWSSGFVSVGTNAQGETRAYMRGNDGLIHTDGDVNAWGNVWSNGFLSVGADAQGVKAYLRGSDGFLYTKGSANVQGSLGVGVGSAMYGLDVGGAVQVRGGTIILRPTEAGGKCVFLQNKNGTLLTYNDQPCPAIPVGG